jgi:hypothetical protein
VIAPQPTHSVSSLPYEEVNRTNTPASFLKGEAVEMPMYMIGNPPVKFDSAEIRDASFVSASIHDETAGGAWNYACQVSIAIESLQERVKRDHIYKSSSLSSSVKTSIRNELAEAQKKVDFIQKTRDILVDFRSNLATQSSIFPHQNMALLHLSTAILSKVQQGESVAIPLDFIGREISAIGDQSHAMIMGIEPEAKDPETKKTSNIKISLFETNGEMSQVIVPRDLWTAHVKGSNSKYFTSSHVRYGPVPDSEIKPSSSRPKIFSKTSLITSVSIGGIKTSSSSQDLPEVAKDLADWICQGKPLDKDTVTEQINKLQASLDEKYGLVISLNSVIELFIRAMPWRI